MPGTILGAVVVAVFAVGCSPQVTLPEPAPGPPTARIEQPTDAEFTVSDGVVTDSRDVGHLVHASLAVVGHNRRVRLETGRVGVDAGRHLMAHAGR